MKEIVITILSLGISLPILANTPGQADLAAGEQKANTICMACHGMNGVSANPIWPSLAGQGEKYIIKQLNDFRADSRKDPIMAPQAEMLSPEDIVNVAVFYAKQATPTANTKGVGDNPEATLAMGEALYRGGNMEKGVPACAACHGPSGGGIAPAAFPQISGQHAQYMRIQLQKFQNAAKAAEAATDAPIAENDQRTNDPNTMMQDIVHDLTPKEIEAVTLYMQGLE